MKQKLTVVAALLFCIALISCGGKKETAASVAQKWCDLNAKAYKAEGPAKEAAEAAREKFEQEMEAKYKDKKEFMDEVEKEVEKCEDASEGRK
jgi:esterase/lipase